MSVREQIILNQKLQDLRKIQNPKESSSRKVKDLENRLPEELVKQRDGQQRNGIIDSVKGTFNQHKINKIDKSIIEQARKTPEKQDNKKRIDQLLVKQYVRTVLDSENAIFSEPEDGDEDLQYQVALTDKELLMRHKGNLPKQRKDSDENKKNRNAPYQKYATQTGSPTKNSRRRSPIVVSGLYDLNIKKLEEEISKLKPVIPKENPCFKSPSRENLFVIEQKKKVAPPPTKYRPVDP